MINLTFKNNRRPWMSANDSTSIKFKRKEIWYIEHDKVFSIRIQIQKDEKHNDGNQNCPWIWIKLRKQSQSIEEARQFLKDNADAIFNKYKIWTGEENG